MGDGTDGFLTSDFKDASVWHLFRSKRLHSALLKQISRFAQTRMWRRPHVSCVSSDLISGGHSQGQQGLPKPTLSSRASLLPNWFLCTTGEFQNR